MNDGLGLDSITFETFGLTPGPGDAGTRQWQGEGMLLSAHFFPVPPDLPSLDPQEIRVVYEGLESSGGAPRRGRLFRRSVSRSPFENRTTRVIDVSVARDGPIPIVRVILRLPLPDFYVYSAALTVPLAECSWVIKVQAAEEGVTGIRETVAVEEFFRERDAKGESVRFPPMPDSTGVRRLDDLMPGFDPYEARWDGLVDDPLSRVRRHIVLVEQSLAFAPEVFEEKPFR